MTPEDELQDLFDLHVDGALSDADRARLDALLADPANADRWERLLALAAAGEALGGARPAEGFADRVAGRIASEGGRPWWREAAVFAAGAAAATLAGLALRAPIPPPQAAVPPPQTVLVRFVFQGEATSVALAGDFNGWAKDAALSPVRPGVWTTEVALPRGAHEYGFLVDGRWVADPAAPEIVDDGFGQRNSRLRI